MVHTAVRWGNPTAWASKSRLVTPPVAALPAPHAAANPVVTVETARPRLTFTAWFAVGDSKETEVLDGVAPVEGERLYIDERGWLHVHVLRRDIE
jgi:hypothetical protein